MIRNYKLYSRFFRSKYGSTTSICASRCISIKPKYDVIIVGAGHNGLVAAAYLQKAGVDVCVLEKRHVIGGAAVTEEIIPEFKFSRASYLLSLFRPQIINDLDLKKYGLKVYLRNPSSYTPLREPGGLNGKTTSLTLGMDSTFNKQQIAQFSIKDSHNFELYEEVLSKVVNCIEPLLDRVPIQVTRDIKQSLSAKKYDLQTVLAFLSSYKKTEQDLSTFYELMTAPAIKILDRWFESEPLKATLATDSVIGAMLSPHSPGSGYVLLHHVMGELEGVKGAWGYVEGGMGSVSTAISNCAVDHGARVLVNKCVEKINIENGRTKGVVLTTGTEIESNIVLSNATPKVTFLDLVSDNCLSEDLVSELKQIDYKSPVTKINVAVNKVPNFLADPNTTSDCIMPHHQTTIHINCEHSDLIHRAYLDSQHDHYSKEPVIEMVIPSSLDKTISPPGSHVVLLFTQYTPYTLANGQKWDEKTKQDYANIVFDSIERYAPGFKDSIIGSDILTPPDLENIIGLTGGNIFHGSMSLDQLYFSRPLSSLSNYKSPIKGLYLCGSGAHPGGGVMGSPGKLAAFKVLDDLKAKRIKK
ncbi:hypothetical protein LOTGIDRAFT_117673 [Lottia gigantea]|uniref:Pyridine nucleotide-disulfide oxidoreductase domain-containing protein 2 n=1 Tax=Lottia gigantea TaxID=225164 RepID=V4ANF5_LOTGI|nr:hypothetical protein LOTGIDRAFT_117673 [Lottia gigantea]ESO95151.1 hypothetical protein LOTGIDRAFT_117673 [Lottia gigantea]